MILDGVDFKKVKETLEKIELETEESMESFFNRALNGLGVSDFSIYDWYHIDTQIDNKGNPIGEELAKYNIGSAIIKAHAEKKDAKRKASEQTMQIEALSDQVRARGSEIESISAEKVVIQRELEELRGKYKDLEEETVQEIEQKKAEVLGLEQSVQEKDEDITALQQSLEEEVRKRQIIEEELQKYESGAISSAAPETDTAITDYLKDMEQDLASKTEEIRGLEEKLAEETKKREALENDLTNTKKGSVAMMKFVTAKYSKEIQELKEQIPAEHYLTAPEVYKILENGGEIVPGNDVELINNKLYSVATVTTGSGEELVFPYKVSLNGEIMDINSRDFFATDSRTEPSDRIVYIFDFEEKQKLLREAHYQNKKNTVTARAVDEYLIAALLLKRRGREVSEESLEQLLISIGITEPDRHRIEGIIDSVKDAPLSEISVELLPDKEFTVDRYKPGTNYTERVRGRWSTDAVYDVLVKVDGEYLDISRVVIQYNEVEEMIEVDTGEVSYETVSQEVPIESSKVKDGYTYLKIRDFKRVCAEPAVKMTLRHFSWE